MSTWTVLKDLVKEKLPDKKYFYCSVKDGTTGDSDEKSGGHISDKDYLTCSKIWNEYKLKNVGDYPDHCLKKDVFYQLMFLKGLLASAYNFTNLILVIIFVLLD